jgi:hypothetical protein
MPDCVVITAAAPVKLSVVINVISIQKIDTVSQTFDAGFVLRMTTLNANERGTFLHTKDCQKISAESRNWEPRIHFGNLVATNSWSMKMSEGADGELSFKYNISATFTQQFHLQSFPFDTQVLTLQLTSSRWCENLEFESSATRRNVIQKENFSQANEFDLDDVVLCKSTKSDRHLSTSGSQRPVYTMSITLRRKPGFYVWNVYLPMSLICLMSLASCNVSRDLVADRLSLTLTLVLTAVAFKFQIGSSLPQVTYLTRVDEYITCSFLFIFLVVIENSFGGKNAANDSILAAFGKNVTNDTDDNGNWGDRTDLGFFAIMAGVWLLGNLYIAVMVLMFTKQTKIFFHPEAIKRRASLSEQMGRPSLQITRSGEQSPSGSQAGAGSEMAQMTV